MYSFSFFLLTPFTLVNVNNNTFLTDIRSERGSVPAGMCQEVFFSLNLLVLIMCHILQQLNLIGHRFKSNKFFVIL